MRILHIGNIANNAYNNAKIQRECGIEADVVCYDYYHIMGTPEWEDAEFEGHVDPNRPDWWATTLRGFRRPRWFAQGPIQLCIQYLLAYRTGDSSQAARLWRRIEREYRQMLRAEPPPRASPWKAIAIAGLWKLIRAIRIRADPRRYDLPPGPLPTWRATIAVYTYRAVLQALLRWIRPRIATNLKRHGGSPAGNTTNLDRGDPLASITTNRDRFAALYDEEAPDTSPETRAAELACAESLAVGWAPLLRLYDIVQGYSIDGYIPLYNEFLNYAAYEHGTLRDIPFQPTQEGRLCRLVYRHAPIVFVTNVDVLPSAEKLGLEKSRIVCLPHAFNDRKLADFAQANPSLRPPSDGVVTFFAPARHHWSSGGPSWEKGNDRLIRAAAQLAREGARLKIILVEWGRDVALSKSLIEELGCGGHFRWVPPLNKRALWTQYLQAHCVANQFIVPGIGGVDFEALTLGRRVITCADLGVLENFFGAAPSLLSAATSDQIAAQMRRVIDDPDDHAGLGGDNREWIGCHHSAERILTLQCAAYERLLGQQHAARPARDGASPESRQRCRHWTTV